MFATLRIDKNNHIEVWGGKDADTSKPPHIIVKSYNDKAALLDGIDPNITLHITPGSTIKNVDIDDSWINDIE